MTRGLVLFAFLSACTPPVELAGLKAGPRNAAFRDHIVATRLDNGLRVAVLPDARTNLVAVTVRYEVGGVDDPADAAGLAHYVEHLLYEPPPGGREDPALYGNASTSEDRTYFYQVGLDNQLDAVLETAARRFEVKCDAFDAVELARERDVVIEERKTRAAGDWDPALLMHAVWGQHHPYSRDVGGAEFAALSRERVCAFIDEHYGPGSATLVVTGNVDAAALERIRARFSTIAARPIPTRAPLPPIEPGPDEVRIPDLKGALAGIVFHAPPAGTPFDAAIDMLNGQRWEFVVDHQIHTAHLVVVGDERARALVAYTGVNEPEEIPAAEAGMRTLFERPTLRDFRGLQQAARNAFIRRFDDVVHAGERIADLMARGEPLTRYRELREIDDLHVDDVTRWITGSGDRAVHILPTADRAGTHLLTEIATSLHHVDVPPVGTSTDLAPPQAPARRIPAKVIEDHLANGLTVWLAPDPAAIAIDARVVMPFDTSGASFDLAAAAATFLRADDGAASNTDAEDSVRWYRSIAVPIEARVRKHATSLRVTGFALFGDWHVWNLARTLIDGRYPDHVVHAELRSADIVEPLSAIEVVARRLLGDRKPQEITIRRDDELDDFRRTHYDPSHAVLIVSGNFDVDRMRAEVRTLFSRWRPLAHVARAVAEQDHAALGFVAVPALHATKLDVVIDFVPTAAAAPQEAAARRVLVALITERLRKLREGLGVTYGMYAVPGRGILVGGAVEPAFAAESARAIDAAIASVRDGDDRLIADFVHARKEALAMALAEPLGAQARADELQRAAESGRGLAGLDDEVEAIRTLDLETVRALAARELRPDRRITVVRGPPDAVRTALAAFGATAFDTVSR